MTTENPSAPLSTSDGARCYIAHFFAREMRRHDFATYIATELAADFACALAQHLAATGKQQAGEVEGEGMATIIAALEHSKPTHDHYQEPVKRHADALAHARALAARQPGAHEPVAPKKIERAVALDLLHAVYKHHGWKRAEGESMTARVHAVYDVTLDARRNRYLATPKNAAPPEQGIDLGQLAALVRQARLYLQDGLNSQCMNKLDDAQALIDQRDAAPGVGNG